MRKLTGLHLVPKEDDPRIYCTFCGKNDIEVDVMLKGVVACICDPCIERMSEMVAERRALSQASASSEGRS